MLARQCQDCLHDVADLFIVMARMAQDLSASESTQEPGRRARKQSRCFCLFFHKYVRFSKHSASSTFPIVSVAGLVLTPHSLVVALKKITTQPQLQASQVARGLRIRLPMQQSPVRSLGEEDPLEKEMATHSSILAWRIPWTGMPGGLQSMGSHRVRHD